MTIENEDGTYGASTAPEGKSLPIENLTTYEHAVVGTTGETEPEEQAAELKFYSIGEAADILGVSIPTLRMYEREGLVLPLRRGSKHRRFSEHDLNRIRCVRSMINVEKVSIAGIKHLLALIPCWKIMNCGHDALQSCAAFHQQNVPCWSLATKADSCNNKECRYCPVYLDIGDCKTLKRTIAEFTNLPGPARGVSNA